MSTFWKAFVTALVAATLLASAASAHGTFYATEAKAEKVMQNAFGTTGSEASCVTHSQAFIDDYGRAIAKEWACYIWGGPNNGFKHYYHAGYGLSSTHH